MSEKFVKMDDVDLDGARPTVAVVGLGFVGVAMVAALITARCKDGSARFNVVGIDQKNVEGRDKVHLVSEGRSPFQTTDISIAEALRNGRWEGNLSATTDLDVLQSADVIVIDINLDVQSGTTPLSSYSIDPRKYLNFVSEVGRRMREHALVVVETTVPPGFTEQEIRPVLERAFEQREMNPRDLRLVHSYERVMPGKNYLASINNYFRVYSGINDQSNCEAKKFFEGFINTKQFPLTKLGTPTASETAKVMENAFRSMNIAFIQEWTAFAHRAGIDLFSVIDAIRCRDTHKNIMSPGFGVGGYCLTKDALVAEWGAREYFSSEIQLRFSVDALQVNHDMPKFTFDLMRNVLAEGAFELVALCGVSYLPDVADTRSSPALRFRELCDEIGLKTVLQDFMIDGEAANGLTVYKELESMPSDIDVVILAQRHEKYQSLTTNLLKEVFPQLKLLIDSNRVLPRDHLFQLRDEGIPIVAVGRGDLSPL